MAIALPSLQGNHDNLSYRESWCFMYRVNFATCYGSNNKMLRCHVFGNCGLGKNIIKDFKQLLKQNKVTRVEFITYDKDNNENVIKVNSQELSAVIDFMK